MNANEHRSMAENLAGPQGIWLAQGPGESDRTIARAQVHATLALGAEIRNVGVWLKEIGDQLDTTPRDLAAVLRLLFGGPDNMSGLTSTGQLSDNERAASHFVDRRRVPYGEASQ